MKLNHFIPLLFIFAIFCNSAFCAEISSSETRYENTAGLTKIRLENISYSDISYNGVENAIAFTIKFKRKAEARDHEEFNEIVSGLDLKITKTGNTLNLRLFTPPIHSNTLFKVIFPNKDWRTEIEISGPKDIDIDTAAEFSDIRVYSVEGEIKIETGFSKIYCYDHTGILNGKLSYGELKSERFSGSFSLDMNMGKYELSLANLSGNSKAKIGMGSFKLALPKNLGAEITSEKSFSNIDLPDNINKPEKGENVVLNNGGYKISLTSGMGKITIDNTLPAQIPLPLKQKTLQPEILKQPLPATSIPKQVPVVKPKTQQPPERKETKPQVEMRTKQAEATPDTIPSIEEKTEISESVTDSVNTYVESNADSLKEEETSVDIAVQTEEEFAEGTIKSIRIRGLYLLSEEDVLDILKIKKGDFVSKEQLDNVIEGLHNHEKLIKDATYTINKDGDLTIRIREIDPLTHDLDLSASFNRVGGLGLGPKLTVKSLFGPVSRIDGNARYNWGNKEWTYNLDAQKKLFDKNPFVIGGTYRLNYESNMDWAIPEEDADLNALFLGLETQNLYQVEGSSGYISQSIGKYFTVKAEYFDDDFSSLKKNTNASIFNHEHIKENNPSLGPGSEGRIKGMRYSVKFTNNSRYANSILYLETENTNGNRPETLPSYTRYLANFASNTKLTRRHTFKFRVAGGYSEDALPDQKAFRLGGLNTLRGYKPGMVPSIPEGMTGFDYQGGGNRMFLVNVDYIAGSRNDDMKFILFGDTGGVWRKGESADVDDLKRDIGVGLAFDNDFFAPVNFIGERISPDDIMDALRINCAVPVGNVSHKAVWTVNFVRRLIRLDSALLYLRRIINLLTFILWCILFVLCWPLAILALILYPVVWVILLPFRLLKISVEGVLSLIKAMFMLPVTLLRGRPGR